VNRPRMPMPQLKLSLALIILTLFTSLSHAQGDLLGRINGLRGSLGLSPYSSNGALAAAAQDHAAWMATTGNVSHVRPDGSSPRGRAAAAGYGSQWVSENIYMGPIANVDDAWNFWVNSAIHYAGLTSPNYTEVGVGVASGDAGNAFVLVFGSPTGPAVQIAAPHNNNDGGNSDGENAAPAEPVQPSFVVGLDAVGNIMHEVQPGDTLGQIALTYGYSWEDIPTMMELNDLAETDETTLAIGSVVLVPPLAGTYTPTPAPTDPPTETPEPTATFTETPQEEALVPPATFVLPSPTATFTPTLPPPVTQVAVVPTQPAITTQSTPENEGRSNPPMWLLIALSVQVGVLLFASAEFIRRMRK